MTNDLRLVFDTSVVVSAVLLPRSMPRQAFDLGTSRGRPLVSAATMAELDDVLHRPKFDKYVSEEQRQEFLASLLDVAEVVEIVESIRVCRDTNDDKFLELVASGHASFLLTGDADLLALHPFRETSIVSPADFLATFAAGKENSP